MVSTFYELVKDIWPPKPTFLPKDYPDLDGKIALVTGSNTGIGYETAKALLKQNATVIFVNRNAEKTFTAIEKIKNELKIEGLDEKIISIKLDLSDLTSIKPAIGQLTTKYGINKIHYSILNAGVMQPINGSKTAQGYELQIGTNCLGHQLLQNLNHPLILNARSASFQPRVIWLSSSAHMLSYPEGGINYDSFKNADNSESLLSYGQSKAGNIYQAYQYAQRNKESGIISVAVHPGYLKSELQRTYTSFQQLVGGIFLFDPVYGSYTELFGALSPKVTMDKTGSYIGPWGQFRVLRDDIEKGLEDGSSLKFWEWANKEVEQYS